MAKDHNPDLDKSHLAEPEKLPEKVMVAKKLYAPELRLQLAATMFPALSQQNPGTSEAHFDGLAKVALRVADALIAAA